MRTDDWPEMLDYYIRSNAQKPYEYGKFDCFLFVKYFVPIITGVEIFKSVKYKTMRGGTSILKKHGGLFNLVKLHMEKAGFDEIAPPFARRGDIVGFKTKAHNEAIGICVGRDFVSPGEYELEYAPMIDAIIAWRIK